MKIRAIPANGDGVAVSCQPDHAQKEMNDNEQPPLPRVASPLQPTHLAPRAGRTHIELHIRDLSRTTSNNRRGPRLFSPACLLSQLSKTITGKLSGRQTFCSCDRSDEREGGSDEREGGNSSKLLLLSEGTAGGATAVTAVTAAMLSSTGVGLSSVATLRVGRSWRDIDLLVPRLEAAPAEDEEFNASSATDNRLNASANGLFSNAAFAAAAAAWRAAALSSVAVSDPVVVTKFSVPCVISVAMLGDENVVSVAVATFELKIDCPRWKVGVCDQISELYRLQLR